MFRSPNWSKRLKDSSTNNDPLERVCDGSLLYTLFIRRQQGQALVSGLIKAEKEKAREGLEVKRCRRHHCHKYDQMGVFIIYYS